MFRHAVAGLLLCAIATTPAAAQTGYDPFDDEIPSDASANWSLIAGNDFIDDVSGGFALSTISPGDGLWQYDGAGLSNATGWTLDARVRVGLGNTAGQRALGVLMREPGGGQLELEVQRGQFFLAGEAAGVIGGAQAFAFDDGDFHNVRVSRLGTNVQVFVDDIATPFVNATFTQTQDFGGNRVFWGRVGSDNAGLAVVDHVTWDNTQAVQSAPGTGPGNNQPRNLSGAPDFMLGWYLSALFDNTAFTTDFLDEMQAHGFNTVRHADVGEGMLGRLPAGSEPAAVLSFMDAAAARGIGVEVYLRKHFADDTANEHANLRGVVDPLKDHAALSMWHIGEEPADPTFNPIALANFKALRHNVAGLDPDHAISAVFTGNGAVFYEDYLPVVDVAAADYYPVRSTAGWDNPARMRDTVGFAQELITLLGPAGATPVWVNQAFDTGNFVLPTADQQRYLTWAPITVGMRGSMYFAFQHMSQSERDTLIYPVTDELVTLIPVITSADTAPTVTSDADTSTPGDGIPDATYIARRHLGETYIFAAGNTLISQTVEFTVTGGTFDNLVVSVIGEGRTITPTITPGQLVFSDGFDPLDVHLYRLMLGLLLGDANNSGTVTADDLIAVQQNFGNVGPNGDGTDLGDANDDGAVTADDLIAVQQNFGNTLGAAAAAVPEPGSLAPLMLGAAAASVRRRRLRLR